MQNPAVSVIIPVWRDVELACRAAAPAAAEGVEIIAVATWEDADRLPSRGADAGGMRWLLARRGRGRQMNEGAAAARGDWLLFVHADSILPAGWLEQVRLAASRGFAAGCFRFGIAAEGWRPRLWERLVALRVALFGLPYGDQGLFVRRELFASIGGYVDHPLMEDVELVTRLRRRTRLWRSPATMRTSARRWERDGWFRRSATNLTLLLRYRFGADVRRLARAYTGAAAAVVAVMARAPSAPGKTRLGRSTEALRRALLLDTWDAAGDGPWERALIFTPREAAAECAALVRSGGRHPLLMPQAEGHLGERMAAASAELFAAGFERVMLIGSDLPDLPPDRIAEANRALRRGADVVLGPADDGGYYLVGLARPAPSIFTGIAWGSPDVRRQTLARAAAAGLRVETIGGWHDIDAPGDLSRLIANGGDRATRTRQTFRAESGPP